MEQARHNVVGSTVRKIRISKDYTQEVLSARCGAAGYEISRGTLAKIEAQIRGVSDLELYVLAKALQLPLEKLYPAHMAAELKNGAFERPL